MPRGTRRKKSSRPPPAPAETQLLYKVVELSTVDEHGLERTVNEWVRKGWALDGVQFAMRESSRRPSMAFVFFTREAALSEWEEPQHDPPTCASEDRLTRLAVAGPTHLVATTPRPDDEDEEHGELGSYREFDPADFEQDDSDEGSKQ